jgi:hypothetical protein
VRSTMSASCAMRPRHRDAGPARGASNDEAGTS